MMRKAFFRVSAMILYVLSVSVSGCYLWIELSPMTIWSMGGKVVLSCIISAGIYFGSLLLSKALSEKSGQRLMKISLSIVFIIYLVLLLSFTLSDRLHGRNIRYLFLWDSEGFRRYLNESFNIIPFRTILNYIKAFFNGNSGKAVIAINILGNICALMPFAVFLPLLLNLNRPKYILTVGTIVVVIELLQMVMCVGSCDIDDVILNVGGAWMLFELLNHSKVKPSFRKIILQSLD